MKKNIIQLLLIFLVCLPLLSSAQIHYTIAGSVQDEKGESIDFATIVLHRLPDSAVVKTTLPDSTGKFLFEALIEGKYFVAVFAQHYTVFNSDAIMMDSTKPSIHLPRIVLTPAANDLNEVNITARKSLMVYKADRTVVNVDLLLSAAGGTALDALERSPGVQVDQNGNISLRGKQGATIYIDDRPTYLSGTDLTNYLKSLPASALDQLELMTNPPANYDAAGNAGIINIKMKKNNVKGFNGGLSLNINQSQLTRSNNSINLNYRNNKISAYTNISYGISNGFANLDLYRTYKTADNTPQQFFEQNTYFRNKGQNLNVVAGSDYFYSDKTTFGIIVTGMGRKGKNLNDNTSNLLDHLRTPDSIIVAQNVERSSFSNLGANLNYRRKFNKDAKLTADADYLFYNNNTNQENRNTGYLPPRIFQAEDTLRGKLPSHINIYSFKVDYTRPGTFKFTLSTGLKISFSETDNLADYTIFTPAITKTDYEKSNHFIYKEHINAAYINLNREMGKLSFQSGLRLENTLSKGHQLGNLMKPDSSFSRSYTNLFPTLYLSYKLDTNAIHQLSINYGRRLDRPYYQDLNPFVSPMDKFTYYTGNPFLRPSFNQNISLSHTYRSKISTILTYSHSKDEVNETIRIQNGIYYSMPGNIGSKTNITLAVDGDFDIKKWLNVHAYSEIGNITSKSDFYTGSLYTTGTYWFIMANARVSPGKDWTLEANGNFRSRIYDAQFIIQNLWQANLAVQKKVNSKITLKLSFNDVFYARKIRGTISNLVQADAGWVNRNDSRNVSLTFNYSFGKTISDQEKYNALGAEAEKNRIK